MLELLLSTKLTSEQLEFAKTANQSADNLLNLINDILDFSKIEAGKLELEFVEFDLRAKVEEVIDVVALRAHEKNLEFAGIISHELPARVIGDPNRIRQILLNLVNNAIKFTEKGEVVVKLTLVRVVENHAEIMFEVKDSGIGIPEDRLHRLFQSFSQVDASTTRKYGGTGLGLAISKQLVEAMSGEIGVSSEYGYGSTFWFRINLRIGVPIEETTQRELESLKSSNFLIVDDVLTNRSVLKEYLRAWGCTFSEAADGEEGLQLLEIGYLERRPYNVALIDMQMANMDGIQLGNRIKEDRRFKDIKLVLLTSMGILSNIKELYDIGFSAYLTKPIKSSQLLSAILAVNRGEVILPDMAISSYRTKRFITDRPSVNCLLVEDNLINQKVASRMLEALGCTVTTAENGQIALDLLAENRFELVFMDIQMPVMGGFEATEKIREREQISGEHIPIIAMTAHAMKGDREKCIAVGMDEYITKPVKPDELENVLKRTLGVTIEDVKIEPKPITEETQPSLSISAAPDAKTAIESSMTDKTQATQNQQGSTTHSADAEIFDVTTALTRIGDDSEFLKELIILFIDDVPKQISKMYELLTAKDYVMLSRVAHTIKGSAANIGAKQLSSACFSLETKSKHPEEVDEAGFSLSIEKIAAELSLFRSEANRLLP